VRVWLRVLPVLRPHALGLSWLLLRSESLVGEVRGLLVRRQRV